MSVATARTLHVGNRLAVFSEAPVVRHSHWLNKVIQQAAQEDRGLLLITPADSAVSRGLLHLLDRIGGLWLVEGDEGDEHFLGRSGHKVQVAEDGAFTVDEAHEPHPAWLREHVGEDRGGLQIQAESLYPRRARTQVGGLMETVSHEVSGAVPHGWGMQEPVTEPWDVRALTRRFSRGQPFDVLLHVAGVPRPGQYAATLEIQRPRNGVVEYVRAAAERTTALTGSELEEFTRRLHRHGVRWAAGQHTVGSDPTLVHPYWLGAAVPAWFQFGPEALRNHDANRVAEFAMAHGAQSTLTLGSGSGTGLAIIFPQVPKAADRAGQHPLKAQELIVEHVLGKQRHRRS